MIVKKKYHTEKGFTLVELLAVMIVLGVVGAMVGIILFSSLRVTTKTNTLASVKQNGFYAISSVTKMLREAHTLDGVSTDGTAYASTCIVPTVGPTTPTPTLIRYKAIKILGLDKGENILSCTDTNIASNSALLIDTNSAKLVTGSCWFTCDQIGVGDLPTIGINFSLTQKSTSTFAEFSASGSAIQFQTSVTLRN